MFIYLLHLHAIPSIDLSKRCKCLRYQLIYEYSARSPGDATPGIASIGIQCRPAMGKRAGVNWGCTGIIFFRKKHHKSLVRIVAKLLRIVAKPCEL